MMEQGKDKALHGSSGHAAGIAQTAVCKGTQAGSTMTCHAHQGKGPAYSHLLGARQGGEQQRSPCSCHASGQKKDGMSTSIKAGVLHSQHRNRASRAPCSPYLAGSHSPQPPRAPSQPQRVLESWPGREASSHPIHCKRTGISSSSGQGGSCAIQQCMAVCRQQLLGCSSDAAWSLHGMAHIR